MKSRPQDIEILTEKQDLKKKRYRLTSRPQDNEISTEKARPQAQQMFFLWSPAEEPLQLFPPAGRPSGRLIGREGGDDDFIFCIKCKW